MPQEEQDVYDPDSIELQMQPIREIGLEQLQIDDLCNRESVKLLLRNHLVTLAQLRENERQVINLRKENLALRQDREELRIGLGRSREHSRVTLLEIPISIMAGFGINMLTSAVSSVQGWFLLLLSLVMLLPLRARKLIGHRGSPRPSKGDGDG